MQERTMFNGRMYGKTTASVTAAVIAAQAQGTTTCYDSPDGKVAIMPWADLVALRAKSEHVDKLKAELAHYETEEEIAELLR